jgi:hypothetical protein
LPPKKSSNAQSSTPIHSNALSCRASDSKKQNHQTKTQEGGMRWLFDKTFRGTGSISAFQEWRQFNF